MDRAEFLATLTEGAKAAAEPARRAAMAS